MNGLDLTQFQFDYDQTWAVLFLRPDGTVLARYGSRNATDAMTLNSMAGFKSTMERVLKADRTWPLNRSLYADKRGATRKYKTAAEIPSPTIKKILSRGDATRSCIHCHNVYDARRDVAVSQKNYDPRKRWKYPFPDNLGLGVDPVTGTKVVKVAKGSAADEAGFKVGDELLSVRGQAIHSLADVQFALHHASDEGVLKAVVNSPTNAETERIVELKPGWRVSDISWRASMYGMPPKPGLWIQPVSNQEKAKRNIAEDRLALKVRGIFGDDVRKSALKVGDWIVGVNDEKDHLTAGEFHAKLRLDYYRPNSRLLLKILRGRDRKDVIVRFR